MKISEASDIKLGTSSVSKVMLGTTKVWPNEHLLYGEIVTQELGLPTLKLDDIVNTPIFNEINNTFYLDSFSNTSPTSIGFDNKANIKTITKLKGLDTSNVTNINKMFFGCSSLTSLDLTNFNTSNVTNMGSMFNNCSSLTSLDLSNFNTSKVTIIEYMFSGCSSLTSLNLSNWDLSNADNVSTFYNCASLTDVYITEEATLMKLTGDLESYGDSFIPSTATIHYNDVDYTWYVSSWIQQ